MKQETGGKWSLKTAGGCRRLLALSLCLILLGGLFAALVSSDFGKVKVTHVELDARGASLEGDLYVPAGVSSKDSLPAIVIGHGGNVSNGVLRSISEEVSRRGIVVLNLSAYASGMSEQPKYDDAGQGVEEYDIKVSPAGMLDAVNFLRTLTYVDKTRIGVGGHSMGNIRSRATADLDCNYLSYNDIMINVLCEEFGQTFTREEIDMDAGELAASRLNADELVHYAYLAQEKQQAYDETIFTACLIGSGYGMGIPSKMVEVGGYEVMRNIKVNQVVIASEFEVLTDGWRYETLEEPKRDWYLGDEDAQIDKWYAIDDVTASSEIVGDFYSTTVTNSDMLAETFDNRAARIFVKHAKETHSKNFFSVQTASDVVEYVTQSFGYNCGELTDPATTPLPASNSIFLLREYASFVSMIGMFLMLFALTGLMLQTEFFAPCVQSESAEELFVCGRKRYWSFAVITVILTIVAFFQGNKWFGVLNIKLLPTPVGSWCTVGLVIWLAAFALLTFIGGRLTTKNQNTRVMLRTLGLSMGWKPTLKSVLMAWILLSAAYGSLMVSMYWFNEWFGIWSVLFLEMRPEYWFIAFRYAIIFIPLYLVIGLSANSIQLEGLTGWKDTLLNVAINSMGIWLVVLIDYADMCIGPFNGVLMTDYICSIGAIFLVPLTAWITRKMYKMTNSVWLGACTNAFLISWFMLSNMGYYNMYFGQDIISVLLGG